MIKENQVLPNRLNVISDGSYHFSRAAHCLLAAFLCAARRGCDQCSLFSISDFGWRVSGGASVHLCRLRSVPLVPADQGCCGSFKALVGQYSGYDGAAQLLPLCGHDIHVSVDTGHSLPLNLFLLSA